MGLVLYYSCLSLLYKLEFDEKTANAWFYQVRLGFKIGRAGNLSLRPDEAQSEKIIS